MFAAIFNSILLTACFVGVIIIVACKPAFVFYTNILSIFNCTGFIMFAAIFDSIWFAASFIGMIAIVASEFANTQNT